MKPKRTQLILNDSRPEWHWNFRKSFGHLSFIVGAGFVHQIVFLGTSLFHAGFVAVRAIADDVRGERGREGGAPGIERGVRAQHRQEGIERLQGALEAQLPRARSRLLRGPAITAESDYKP